MRTSHGLTLMYVVACLISSKSSSRQRASSVHAFLPLLLLCTSNLPFFFVASVQADAVAKSISAAWQDLGTINIRKMAAAPMPARQAPPREAAPLKSVQGIASAEQPQPVPASKRIAAKQSAKMQKQQQVRTAAHQHSALYMELDILCCMFCFQEITTVVLHSPDCAFVNMQLNVPLHAYIGAVVFERCWCFSLL